MSQTDRQTVLAALDAGMSMGEAAKHFGISKGTIGYWASQRRAGKYAAEPVKLAIAPPLPPVRAREAKTAAVAAAIGPELRASLRASVADLTAHVASEAKRARAGRPDEWVGDDWRPPDMHQVASAARALVALLDKAGDLLAFDKTLMTETEAIASAPPTATDVAGEIAKRRRQQSTG